MNPETWGPHCWFLIHSVALNYPKNPTDDDMKHYQEFYNGLQYVLPCSTCSQNYKKHLKELPITNEVLSSRKTLFYWTVDIHNKVNKMKGKSKYSPDRVLEKLSREYNVSKYDLL